jgi:5'(3')-deoxyribonucleotidase
LLEPRVLIDTDDVTADFVTPVSEILSNVLGRPWSCKTDMQPGEWDMFWEITEGQKHAIFQTISDPAWHEDVLKPFPEAQEALPRLREVADVFNVTSAMSWAPVREWWLKEHLGYDKDHMVFTKAKHIVSGDFFIDDNPALVQRWQRHNPYGVGMLWSGPNNAHLTGYDDIRVYGWDEVIERVSNWILNPRRVWC